MGLKERGEKKKKKPLKAMCNVTEETDHKALLGKSCLRGLTAHRLYIKPTIQGHLRFKRERKNLLPCSFAFNLHFLLPKKIFATYKHATCYFVI